MKQFHFNFKDVFQAPRLAFSIQRIWINGTGFLAGYIVYLVLTYISLLTAGYSFDYIWRFAGLLPCAFALPVPWYAMIICAVGLIAWLAIILLTNTAVSRVVYMNLRDELFYTWTQAYRFAFKKWISSLGAVITFLFIIGFFVVAALGMGLIGRIPYVGELGTALLTVPYILSALLLFFIAIAFGIGLFFVPAIIATSDEDALGGVFQSFSITFNQPWRIVVYMSLLGILYLVGLFLFAVALKIAYGIFIFLFSVGMGEKFFQVQQQALYVIDHSLPVLYSWAQLLPGNLGCWVYISSPHPWVPEMSGTIAVSGYILGIFLLFLGGMVITYGEAIFNSGLTIIYVILYKLQERESLLEREDEELKEEEEEESEETKEVSKPETEKTKEPEAAPTKKPRKQAAKPRKPRKKE